MPAIFEDADWDTWLGENDSTSEQAKAVLKTIEGVNWKIEPERKTAKWAKPSKPDRPAPPQSDLF